jgi:hypothetical protein
MQGMALIGATLHFGYSDMLNMELEEFMFFMEQAKAFSEN